MVDLRSDTVTRRTPEMRRAMAKGLCAPGTIAPGTVRMVTHHDVDREGIDRACKALATAP